MILRFLGRGSAFNTRECNTSAYIITEDKSLILLDCGEKVFNKLINTNLLSDISSVHVLITHLHSDHVGSLSSLIYYCYYIKKMKINVYFPYTDEHELKEYLSLQGNIDNATYNLIYMPCNSYSTIELPTCNVIIAPKEVSHDINLNCYGYYIKYLGKSIWYSGDCNDIPKDIKIENIDEFYQDTCDKDYEGNVHLSLSKLRTLIPKEYRNKVYCMHIDNSDITTLPHKYFMGEIINAGFNLVSDEYKEALK